MASASRPRTPVLETALPAPSLPVFSAANEVLVVAAPESLEIAVMRSQPQASAWHTSDHNPLRDIILICPCLGTVATATDRCVGSASSVTSVLTEAA